MDIPPNLPVPSRWREIWGVRAPAASSITARRCCQGELPFSGPELPRGHWVQSPGSEEDGGSGVAICSYTLAPDKHISSSPLGSALHTHPVLSARVSTFWASLVALPVRRYWLGLPCSNQIGFFNFSFINRMGVLGVFLQEVFWLLLQNGRSHPRAPQTASLKGALAHPDGESQSLKAQGPF